MKKHLLLVLMAFFSVSTFAQTVIYDDPAGEQKVYKRTGMGVDVVPDGKGGYKAALIQLDTLTTESANLQVVYAADGKTVYLKAPIATLNIGSWVRGSISGNTITVPVDQYVYMSNQGWGIQVAMAKEKATGGYEKNTAVTNITYTVSNNTITLNGTDDKNFLSAFYSDDNSWAGYSEMLAVYNFDQDATNGIETVEGENAGSVVAEKYFDLSGKQLSEPAKGVTIKQVKYSDGTQKAVKFIGK